MVNSIDAQAIAAIPNPILAKDSTAFNIHSATNPLDSSNATLHWQPCWDHNVGAYYYWNTVTNATTWENPFASVINTAAPIGGGNHEDTPVAEPEYTDETASSDEPPATSVYDDHLDHEPDSRVGVTATRAQDLDRLFDHIERMKHHSFLRPPNPSAGIDREQLALEQRRNFESEDAEIYAKFNAIHRPVEDASYAIRGRFNRITQRFESDFMSNEERFSDPVRTERHCDSFFDYRGFLEERGRFGKLKVKMTQKELEKAIRKKKRKKALNKKKWLLEID